MPLDDVFLGDLLAGYHFDNLRARSATSFYKRDDGGFVSDVATTMSAPLATDVGLVSFDNSGEAIRGLCIH